MDVSLDCSWSHRGQSADLAPRSLLTLRGVEAATRDNLDQYRASRMSGIESAASMFLRSGSLASPEAGPAPGLPYDSKWGYAPQHCSSCDLGAGDLHNMLRPAGEQARAGADSWGDGGAGSGSGESGFRAKLQAQGQGLREGEMNGVGAGHDFSAPGSRIAGYGSSSLFHEAETARSYTIQDLIAALHMGGSRSKMEAAITVRSLAASHNMHQVAFIAAGGIRPLVDLLSYEAGETHWPPEMREKATITVRAEAALALASLSVSNDDNKGAIGAAGAIPLLCDLIQFDEESYNAALASYQKQEMAPFLVLARDAGAGALSCLARNENNKEAIIAAQAVPVLVRIVDRGTSFGRAAAANVLAKLATGSNAQNKLLLGKEGAISAILRLLKDGSPKARETGAEALFNLAMHPWNKSKIIQEGGMASLLRMVEGGSQPEKDAATAALKILRSSVGAPPNPRPLTGSRCSRRSEGSCMRENELETFKFDSIQQSRELFKDLNEHPQSSTEKSCVSNSAGSISVLKAFSGLGATTPMQSELTSSLAPHLTGQPSMQADAAINFTKPAPKSVQSRKKLKTSQSEVGGGSCRVSDQGATKVESVQMLYAEDRGNRITSSSSWERSGQAFQGSTFQEAPQSRLRPSRQGVDGAAQPVAGGIFALVNALSSQNPGAQEFAALALMLLASQGGYEVKTAIADAGAIEPLIFMVGSSSSPLIRESAAAAIAKLVSCHPGNRAAVVRAGGVKAMVDMAKWSSTLVDGPSGGGNLGARTQAAAIVAVLNISEVLDRHSMGMGLRDALPCLAQMLESENVDEITAGVAGLQILGVSLGIEPAPMMERECGIEEDFFESKKFDFVATEMVTALLDVMRGTSAEAKESATEALAGLAARLAKDGPEDGGRIPETWRKYGIDALLLLLRRAPLTASLKEIVAGTIACVVASPVLCVYLCESALVPDLMRLIQEGPTMATRILAAAAVANLGSRKKTLDVVSDTDIALLLRILGGQFELPETTATTGGVDDICFLQPFSNTEAQASLNSQLQQRSMPHMLLCEHASAILVYAALSGENRKQAMIDLGAAPILVRVLQSCISTAESCLHPTFLQGVRPIVPQATQEFALMGLILLADKSTETMEKIVKAGGIPVLVRLLGATGGRGKLGASWSEMAAAALLTMAGCEAAREEIISVGGISSLVQVLKGEGGTSLLSLTGLAAMAQLLGVLALKSQEAKLHMAKAGAVRCLVEILVGGNCLAWAADGECGPREGPGLLALAQEAAAAALATVVLDCPENAEVAVEAGSIGPLVRMLGVSSSPPKASGGILELAPEGERGDSGASSADTGVAQDTTALKILSSPDSDRRPAKPTTAHDDNGRGNRVGGSLAAMAALGNMISCLPQCRREIVDAGGLTKLVGLLHSKAGVLSRAQGDAESIAHAPEGHTTCSTKLQESAALVLGLLAEGDPKVQETIGSTEVIPTLIELSAISKNDGFAARALSRVGKDHEQNQKRIKEAAMNQGSHDVNGME